MLGAAAFTVARNGHHQAAGTLHKCIRRVANDALLPFTKETCTRRQTRAMLVSSSIVTKHLLLLVPALPGTRALPPPVASVGPSIRPAALVPISAPVPAVAVIPAHALQTPASIISPLWPAISISMQAPGEPSGASYTIITVVIAMWRHVGVPGSIPCYSFTSRYIPTSAFFPVGLARASRVCPLPVGVAGLP